MQKSLDQIQGEIGMWAHDQFGLNCSKNVHSPCHGYPLDSLPPLLGMQEELGELARVVLREHQGRGKPSHLEAKAAMEDALADTLVYMCDFAYREGINLSHILNVVWDKVQKRRQATWQDDKSKETLHVAECSHKGIAEVPKTGG